MIAFMLLISTYAQKPFETNGFKLCSSVADIKTVAQSKGFHVSPGDNNDMKKIWRTKIGNITFNQIRFEFYHDSLASIIYFLNGVDAVKEFTDLIFTKYGKINSDTLSDNYTIYKWKVSKQTSIKLAILYDLSYLELHYINEPLQRKIDEENLKIASGF